MESRERKITAVDRKRIKDAIARWEQQGAIPEYGPDDGLNAVLDSAGLILEVTEVPGDLVTMNSRVRLRDAATKADTLFTLSYPEESAPAKGRISIFSAEGCALLGARAGETLSWPTPQGPRRYLIEEILYQPESAGDHDF
jgi:regulator of nucleoside diphosphate kinase